MIKRFFSRQRSQEVTPNEIHERKSPLKVGYVRTSPTKEQLLEAQLERLRADGCSEIFTDKGVSAAAQSRPGLDLALQSLRPGDTLVVWKLDRLGRSLAHLIELLEGLKDRGVEFRSLSDSIDTTTTSGKLHFATITALAEFERGLISERTEIGVAAARSRGVKFGRKPKLTYGQAAMAKELIEGKDGNPRTRKEVAMSFGVSQPTLRRALKGYELD